MRIVTLCVVLVAACHRPDATSPGGAVSPAAKPPSMELLANLSFLATGTIPPETTTQAWADRLARGEQTMANYVDALLADKKFPTEVAPRVLLAEWQANGGLYALPRGYILKKTAPDPAGNVVYYLRDQGCSAEKAKTVVPWWDPDSKVLVCDEAYRPERFEDASGHHCNGVLLAPGESSSTFCGCGPNLLRCFPDAERYAKVSKSLIDEVNATTAKIVGEDRPIRELYTSNESFRDRDAEFIYRRWRVESGELKTIPDIRDWPEAGQWAPRYEATPGQHAGILTTTQVIFRETGLRSITKNIYDKIWCKDAESANVQANVVLALHATDLRAGEGWQQLAHQAVCETCHARLDYGMQFLKGYADVRIATHFTPQPAVTGALYGDSSKDLRGNGQLTPKGFAELAVNQPEFEYCMVQGVTRHVFNHRADPEDTQAVQEALKRTGNLREMMKVALLRYAAAFGMRSMTVASIGTSPSSTVAPDHVAMSPKLHGLVEEHCGDCHGDGSENLDLSLAVLPRATAEKMLNNVAFEAMPKGGALAGEVRTALVTELIANLWTSRAERETAIAFFVHRMRALPIHRGTQAVDYVRHLSGSDTRGQLRLMETTVRQDQAQFTPGFAAVVGLEAIRACNVAGHKGEALERCLETATAPQHLVNGLGR